MATITPDDKITIAMSVKDRAATAAWFKQHLGFEAIFSVDEAGWTELATNAPGVTIGLGDAEEVTPASTTPVFGVADFDTAHSALASAGVKMDEQMEVPGMVKLVTFYDPDGNPLMIAQDLSA
jgi:predicted enzyme related to lactoylglutathione lyase